MKAPKTVWLDFPFLPVPPYTKNKLAPCAVWFTKPEKELPEYIHKDVVVEIIGKYLFDYFGKETDLQKELIKELEDK